MGRLGCRARPGAAARPASDAGGADVGPAARALARAIDRAAAEQLGSPCERAYAATLALRRASKARLAPRPEEFMEVCSELPEEMQLCLSPGYQVEHLDECVAAREALDPELLRRLQELLQPR